MSVAVGKPVVTPEQLLAMPNSNDFELVDGVLRGRHGRSEGRPMSALTSWIGGQITIRLENFVATHNLGWVFPADSGYQCFPDRPRNLRRPDVSFVRFERLEADEISDEWLQVVPDLVVEVVSPNDLAYEVEEKIEEFRQVGCP